MNASTKNVKINNSKTWNLILKYEEQNLVLPGCEVEGIDSQPETNVLRRGVRDTFLGQPADTEHGSV
jgi:hypothetical protein